MKGAFVLTVLAILASVAAGASVDAVDTIRGGSDLTAAASRAHVDDAATAHARSGKAAAASDAGSLGTYPGRGYINVDGYYMAFGSQLPSDRRSAYSGYACGYKGSKGKDGATKMDLTWYGAEVLIKVESNEFSVLDWAWHWCVTVMGSKASDTLDGAFRVSADEGLSSMGIWTMREHPSKAGAMALQLRRAFDYWAEKAQGQYIALGPDRDASTKYLILTDDVNAAATVTIER